MIRMPLSEVISRIQKNTSLSEEDILAKIEEKQNALSGLISKEGAAHIVANELGVKIFDSSSGKIKDLFPGMRNVEFVGRVTQVFDVRSFSRADGSQGKVASFNVGDDTGFMRVVCWGSQTDIISQLSEGVPVKVVGGFVRENQRGFKEVHLNDSSKVVVNPDDSVPEVKKNVRKSLKDLNENDVNVEILGTIVQVFDPYFFEVCPDCNARLNKSGDKFSCPAHGEVVPSYSYVLNVYVDDGSDTMRVVLFRNQVEKLLNKSKEEILKFRDAPEAFDPLKTDLLGEQFRFIGRVKKNTFFDRLEFTANQVFPVDESQLK